MHRLTKDTSETNLTEDQHLMEGEMTTKEDTKTQLKLNGVVETKGLEKDEKSIHQKQQEADLNKKQLMHVVENEIHIHKMVTKILQIGSVTRHLIVTHMKMLVPILLVLNLLVAHLIEVVNTVLLKKVVAMTKTHRDHTEAT